MYLLIAAGLFSIFFANVVLGAFADAARPPASSRRSGAAAEEDVEAAKERCGGRGGGRWKLYCNDDDRDGG